MNWNAKHWHKNWLKQVTKCNTKQHKLQLTYCRNIQYTTHKLKWYVHVLRAALLRMIQFSDEFHMLPLLTCYVKHFKVPCCWNVFIQTHRPCLAFRHCGTAELPFCPGFKWPHMLSQWPSARKTIIISKSVCILGRFKSNKWNQRFGCRLLTKEASVKRYIPCVFITQQIFVSATRSVCWQEAEKKNKKNYFSLLLCLLLGFKNNDKKKTKHKSLHFNQ